jgi:hypothetical protein
LNENLGLAARAHQPLKLQELGQLNGGSSLHGDRRGVLQGVPPT